MIPSIDSGPVKSVNCATREWVADLVNLHHFTVPMMAEVDSLFLTQYPTIQKSVVPDAIKIAVPWRVPASSRHRRVDKPQLIR